jgi:hypothetical protein
MGTDWLFAASIAFILSVSLLYALTEAAWWHRRQPRRPVPYLPGRAPGTVPEHVAAAEALVADAYARYGDLYDTPLPGPMSSRGPTAHP